MSCRLTLAAAIAACLLTSCGAKSGLIDALAGDGDADADADTDADADGDGDADVDGDADPFDCGQDLCADFEHCCVEERCVDARSGCCVDEECPPGLACFEGSSVCGVQDLGCGLETLDVRPIAPNLFILLDRSGSMAALVDGRPKWDIAIDALGVVLPAYEADVRFGLMMFPGPLASCDAGLVDVDVGEAHADEILQVLADSEPLLTTPMAASLETLGDLESLRDEDRRNLVLLVTDGEESCGGAPVTETQHLWDAGIQVYVVGFGAEVDAGSLSAIAEAGRTERPGDPSYYQAEDEESLSQALGDVVRSVIPCAFDLVGQPPLPEEVYVYFDGASGITRDASHLDGWDYDEGTNVLTFYGPTCDAVKTDQHVVQVVFGCPEGR